MNSANRYIVGLAGKRPSKLLRWLFNIPIFLHKIGLRGWERLIGIRFILIATKGRRTGRTHSVLVDILEYDSSNDFYYVQSAYGTRADWVRNIQVNPIFKAQVGRRHFSARAEQVPREKTAEILIRYIDAHKFYAKTMMRTIGVDLDAFTEYELRTKLQDELVIAIKPL
jgi:deazaflavin-dependent oxidoreductase (nitroreductase family)